MKLFSKILVITSVAQGLVCADTPLPTRANTGMQLTSKVYVAGHTGLVGSTLFTKLKQQGYSNIITRRTSELDLRDQKAVDSFFAKEKPEFVFLAAAKVGGIVANMTYPAEFIYDNLMMEANVIHSAYKHGVKKLLFLGSSCIYPRACSQPIHESYLLTSPLEPTNEPYAIAKIAGLKMCDAYNRQYGTNFIACMPTNLYGPGDNFHLTNSHVIPALIAKIYAAHKEGKKEVVLWGTGSPRREFLHVDDLARGLIFLMNTYNGSELVNIGTGTDVTIYEVAHLVKDCIGYKGDLVFDSTKPDGTPRKLLNVDKINALGWKAVIPLQQGLKETIDWYITHRDNQK